MNNCQHIWNAHGQCQWCHRMKRDVEYDEMKAELSLNHLEEDNDFWRRRAKLFEKACRYLMQQVPEEKLAAVAEHCRTSPGPCYCGCHLGTTTQTTGKSS